MKHYPSSRYHPEHGHKLVQNEAEDMALKGWFHSPADFGIETCPGKEPDAAIAAKKDAPKAEPVESVEDEAEAVEMPVLELAEDVFPEDDMPKKGKRK